jgi:hypothetical protein
MSSVAGYSAHREYSNEQLRFFHRRVVGLVEQQYPESRGYGRKDWRNKPRQSEVG